MSSEDSLSYLLQRLHWISWMLTAGAAEIGLHLADMAQDLESWAFLEMQMKVGQASEMTWDCWLTWRIKGEPAVPGNTATSVCSTVLTQPLFMTMWAKIVHVLIPKGRCPKPELHPSLSILYVRRRYWKPEWTPGIAMALLSWQSKHVLGKEQSCICIIFTIFRGLFFSVKDLGPILMLQDFSFYSSAAI